MIRLMVALALVALASSHARAQQPSQGSAGYMVSPCRDWLKVAIDKDVQAIGTILRRDPGRLTAVGMCAGFVVGTWESLRAFELFCPPDGVTNEQLVRMVVKQVENHPESMHEDFIVPVAAVMIAMWPCPRK